MLKSISFESDNPKNGICIPFLPYENENDIFVEELEDTCSLDGTRSYDSLVPYRIVALILPLINSLSVKFKPISGEKA